jgi:hypothetical protein
MAQAPVPAPSAIRQGQHGRAATPTHSTGSKRSRARHRPVPSVVMPGPAGRRGGLPCQRPRHPDPSREAAGRVLADQCIAVGAVRAPSGAGITRRLGCGGAGLCRGGPAHRHLAAHHRAPDGGKPGGRTGRVSHVPAYPRGRPPPAASAVHAVGAGGLGNGGGGREPGGQPDLPRDDADGLPDRQRFLVFRRTGQLRRRPAGRPAGSRARASASRTPRRTGPRTPAAPAADAAGRAGADNPAGRGHRRPRRHRSRCRHCCGARWRIGCSPRR